MWAHTSEQSTAHGLHEFVWSLSSAHSRHFNLSGVAYRADEKISLAHTGWCIGRIGICVQHEILTDAVFTTSSTHHVTKWYPSLEEQFADDYLNGHLPSQHKPARTKLPRGSLQKSLNSAPKKVVTSNTQATSCIIVTSGFSVPTLIKPDDAQLGNLAHRQRRRIACFCTCDSTLLE